MTDIPYHAKDRLFKALVPLLRSGALAEFGVRLPPMEEAVPAPSEVPEIVVRTAQTDALYRLPDGTFVHLEFQWSADSFTLSRFLGYDVALVHLVQKYDSDVHTVVFLGPDAVPLPPRKRWGGIAYDVQIVHLGSWDTDAILAHALPRARQERRLSDADLFRLAVLPVCRLSRPLLDVARDVVPALLALGTEHAQLAALAHVLFAYSKANPHDKPALLEVLQGMPIGEELVRDIMNQGITQGELLKAREDVLDVLTARFGGVSDEARKRVETTNDLALLKQWLIRVAQADSPSSAEQVILGDTSH